jgi:crotonobetainyl-CoA:carnitine CoA-transferase CaiB-like acyl-CoA transferase
MNADQNDPRLIVLSLELETGIAQGGDSALSSLNMPENSDLLRGINVVSLSINTPGPVGASRLARLGANVTKIEPPTGDPLKTFARGWYESLAQGQTIVTLDLKSQDGRAQLGSLLSQADLLLASYRPSALARLGLDWETLHGRFPRLCFAGIIGYPPPQEEKSGHDLTYLAETGLVTPPELPSTLFVDLAGAERCVSQALALLIHFARTGEAGHALISLYECAEELSAPVKAGLTNRGGILGGGTPFYGVYQAGDGWVAIAALEPHFAQRLLTELNIPQTDHTALARAFRERSADEWEQWAAERDLPIVKVR